MGDPAREVDTDGDSPSCREASIDSFSAIPANEHAEVLPVVEGGGGPGQALDAFLPLSRPM